MGRIGQRFGGSIRQARRPCGFSRDALPVVPLHFPVIPRILRRSISPDSLARDLDAAGIGPGDVLLVHSSLKSIGYVEGGPASVVRVLQAAVSPGGTLVMPTFTYNIAGWSLGAFDHAQTPSATGLVTEVFRRMPGVLRSCHPSHSFAAWGAMAREIAHAPLGHSPLGEGSPLDTVRRAGGRILLVGVGQERNSSLHLAECLARVPYLSIAFTPGQGYEIGLIRDPLESVPIPLPLVEVPGSSEGFPAIEPALRERGLVRDARLGQARCQLMDARSTVEAAVSMLRADPELFLHGREPSNISSRRLAYLRTRQEIAS